MNDTLYRKYRPIDFDDVLSQDHIVTTLKNQILKNKVGHAYLFCGTRGTGKTTVAKIFARAINCKNRTGYNPCNTCESCKASLDNTSINIVEMDAASNKGIDNIRNLKSEIEYAPLNGDKYKIYILDEVHELTKDAYNALLKTLEEPPEYVVFILATTNVEQLPDTILSRCQRYDFNRITLDKIIDNLEKISKLENINIDKDAITYIAEKSDGSMRDSISKLDRCRLIDENIVLTKEKVAEILGLVDDEVFSRLLFSISTKNISEIASIVANSLDSGKDILNFVNDFIWHLRNLLLIKDLKEVNDAINISKEHFLELKKETERYERLTLIYYIKELSKVTGVMKYDENKRVTLEANLIKLAITESAIDEDGLRARLEAVESKLQNNNYNNNYYLNNTAADTSNTGNNNNQSANTNNNDNNYQYNLNQASTDKTPNLSNSQNLQNSKNEKTEETKKSESLETIEKNFKEIFTELVGAEKALLKKCNVLLSEEKNENDKKEILGVTFFVDPLDYSLIGGDDKIKILVEKLKEIIKSKFNRESKIIFKKQVEKEKVESLDGIVNDINKLIEG